MTLSDPSRRPQRAASGFTLVELLVVVAIIAITSAVAMPAVLRYMKTYRIRTAAQELATELQTARNRAIMKNVNLGVVFLTLSPTTYRWVIEDDQDPPISGMRRPLATLLSGCPDNGCAQAGPLRTLPPGIQFVTANPNVKGLRYDRMGLTCNPDGTDLSCPVFDTGATWVKYGPDPENLDMVTSIVTLQEQQSKLKMTIKVVAGGRIQMLRSWQS